MDASLISVISACTALVASIVGPLVTLLVAKRQFSASVLSANRQKWIENLRDNLAELISLFVAITVVKRNWKGPWEHGMPALASNPVFIAKFERAILVQWEIRLLIKPHEPGHKELLQTIMAIIEHLKAEDLQEERMEADLERMTAQAQGVLKYEWERVKRGV